MGFLSIVFWGEFIHVSLGCNQSLNLLKFSLIEVTDVKLIYDYKLSKTGGIYSDRESIICSSIWLREKSIILHFKRRGLANISRNLWEEKKGGAGNEDKKWFCNK